VEVEMTVKDKSAKKKKDLLSDCGLGLYSCEMMILNIISGASGDVLITM